MTRSPSKREPDQPKRARPLRRTPRISRLLRTKLAFGRLVALNPDRQRLLDEACRLLVDRGGLRMAWASRIEFRTGRVVPAAWAGHVDGYLDELTLSAEAPTEGWEPSLLALRGGRKVTYTDLENERMAATWRVRALERGYRSSASFALIADGETAGSLGVFAGEPGAIGDEEASLLEELAGTLGRALRSAAEREQKELADRRLRAAVAAGRVGLWDWDLVTGSVSYSREWKGQLGYEEDEIADTFEEWRSRVHPEDLDTALARIHAFLARPELGLSNEFRMRHRDGSWRRILAQADVVADSGGRPIRMLGSHVDVTEIRRGEEQRERLSKRVSEILENVSDAFVSLDRDWKYTYVNRKAGEIFGRDPETLVGRHIWTEFPEGVGQPFHAAYERAMAEQTPVELEEHYAPYDRWFENRIHPSPDGLSVFFHDITDRKRAQLLLEDQKAVLEAIARGEGLSRTLESIALRMEARRRDMKCSLLLLDPDGAHLRHGAAPSLPPAFVAAIDGEPIGPRAGSCGTAAFRGERVIVTDIASDPLWDGYREFTLGFGLRACWSAPIWSSARTVLGTFAMYYAEPKAPTDEDLRLIDSATSLAGIAIERHRAEEEIRRLNRDLEARVADRTARLEGANAGLRRFSEEIRDLYDNAPCGYHSLDADGTFVQINATELTWLGYEREELVGRIRFTDLLSAEGRETFRRSFPRFKTQGWIRDLEFGLKRKDGTTFPVLLSATAVKDESGQFRLSRSTVFDLTERRKADDKVAQYTAQLQTANRHLQNALGKAESAERVKSAFLAAMSHELRTPLNSVIGFTGALLGGLVGPVSAEQREALEIVQRNGRHLLDLINDVLDISKIEAGEMRLSHQPFDLSRLAREAVLALGPQAETRGLRLLLEAGPETIPLDGDGRRVSQVLLNLLSNAVKFTERGEVCVRVSLDGEGCRAAVAVRDTGPGILAADLGAIFKEFVQLDTGTARTQEGTGLGLALSRKLARMMGGDVVVESTRGAGSTFTFWLPAAGGAK